MATPHIPSDPRQIDAAWLGEALAERHPGARVAAVELLEHHEATNAHARLRVDYHEPAGAPPTLFCKLLPSEPGRRAAIAQTGMGLREARFYADLADAFAMRTPRVHVARHDEAGNFALLLEDLGATGCTVSDGPTSVSVDSATRALADLAQMHLRFLDPARRRGEAPWVAGPMPASDYGSSRLRYGLDHHRDRLSDAFAEMAELYIEKREALHALWHFEPVTLIHGDTHIGNLFDDRGRTGFLDWGMIHLGSPLRDVSYFLTMALSIEDRRAHERELLREYLEIWGAGCARRIGFDEAWKAHRLLTSYLAPASCQIATFPETDSPRRRKFSQAFLARAEAAIEDLEVRQALRQYAGL